MKCPKCGSDIQVGVGAKVITKGCKVLTSFTTILTCQCEKCGAIFQIPVESKSFMSVKEDR